jgi:hypothetical protein
MSTQAAFIGLDDTLAARSKEQPSSPSLNLPVQVSRAQGSIAFSGTMEHFTPGAASIILDQSMLIDTTVQVECNGFQFAGEVAYCHSKEGAYEIHVAISDVDELGVRRSPRYAVNLPAKIYGAEAGERFDVTLVDISRDGIGLESRTPLHTDEAVCVESELCMAFATVRHCRQVASGRFRAGLEVQYAIAKEHPSPSPVRLGWFCRLFSWRVLSLVGIGLAMGALAEVPRQFWR